MNRTVALAAAVVGLAVLPAIAVAHDLDHPAPSFVPPGQPLSANFNAGGPGADWDLLTTLVTGNPHSDLDYFTQGGETYASVGLLGSSANGGGQSIVKLTDKGAIKPAVISQHPSASCAAVAASATGLQHDVEATPKGNVIFNTDVLQANRNETQLLLDASDAAGRCHDNGTLGARGAPRGGLEIIDVTDPSNPRRSLSPATSARPTPSTSILGGRTSPTRLPLTPSAWTRTASARTSSIPTRAIPAILPSRTTSTGSRWST
ncbi:MAG TPA: hypothetical protein VFD31_10655 [Thermoleophilaceae bacterium]|nr:hypothetical protein [Thermoleophilaceae bacterium]